MPFTFPDFPLRVDMALDRDASGAFLLRTDGHRFNGGGGQRQQLDVDTPVLHDADNGTKLAKLYGISLHDADGGVTAECSSHGRVQ